MQPVALLGFYRHETVMDQLLPRIAPFVLVLSLALMLEHVIAARPHAQRRILSPRTRSIAILFAVDLVVARLVLPVGLVGVALWASAHSIGLFQLIEMPLWAKVATAWIVLDFTIWVQHVAMHKISWLWRLHRVHHSDTTMDALTALRFHPLEIALSLLWKALVVLGLGAPVEAVLLFEIGLSSAAVLNHANIAIPPHIDRALSRVLATPAFHLVHHHPDRRWTNSNFGNVLSLWDHMAGLARALPEGPAQIGIDGVLHDERVSALLLQPFR
jgi:sterol desaturase/sphingolipid hydroxylase (fatty acid hydroxylase superfamily)